MTKVSIHQEKIIILNSPEKPVSFLFLMTKRHVKFDSGDRAVFVFSTFSLLTTKFYEMHIFFCVRNYPFMTKTHPY